MALLALLLAITAADDPSHAYYMVVFGFDDRSERLAVNSHTFATFVKVRRPDSVVEVKTISWYPKSRVVRLIGAAEPGVNLSLEETLEIARRKHFKVVKWGPIEVQPELYAKVSDRIRQLELGQLRYLCLGSSARSQQMATNCIHAASDVGGVLYTGANYGEVASKMVFFHLSKWAVRPDVSHAWLERRLLPKPEGRFPVPPVVATGTPARPTSVELQARSP